MEDIWDYIKELKRESLLISKNNTQNSTLKDIFYQLPFFVCPNHFISEKHQKDITKYLYCDASKTPPHSGSYGDTPNTWKEKHFLIKQALSILYMDKREQINKKHGNR